MMAQVAGKTRGGELLLLEEPKSTAGAQSSEVVPRGVQLADLLLDALEGPQPQEEGMKVQPASLTAVISQDDFDTVIAALRSESREELYERRYPYLLFSGRPVARFEREATGQELLIIEAGDWRRATQDPIDYAFSKKMAVEHPPDLLAFDLSEAAWREISGEFAQVAGSEPWKDLRVRGLADAEKAST